MKDEETTMSQLSIERRAFLRDGVLLAAGAIGGGITTNLLQRGLTRVRADEPAPGIEQRLRALGIELPQAPKPVAVYVPAVRVGNLLFVSGHGPTKPDGTMVRGKVGGDLSVADGSAAARLVGLNILSTVRSTIGSLDNVVRVVKVLGMVNCTPSFGEQPKVINGFSELMVQVFGEKNGKAARSAVGMGSLPNNIAVEIEAIFEVRAEHSA
jgi:enamine deaminase RidA (YjgF/YER057c/UK114 family)